MDIRGKQGSFKDSAIGRRCRLAAGPFLLWYGGDEFVIVLPATLLDKAAEYAKRYAT